MLGWSTFLRGSEEFVGVCCSIATLLPHVLGQLQHTATSERPTDALSHVTIHLLLASWNMGISCLPQEALCSCGPPLSGRSSGRWRWGGMHICFLQSLPVHKGQGALTARALPPREGLTNAKRKREACEAPHTTSCHLLQPPGHCRRQVAQPCP